MTVGETWCRLELHGFAFRPPGPDRSIGGLVNAMKTYATFESCRGFERALARGDVLGAEELMEKCYDDMVAAIEQGGTGWDLWAIDVIRARMEAAIEALRRAKREGESQSSQDGVETCP